MDHKSAKVKTIHHINNNGARNLVSNIKTSLLIIFLTANLPLPISSQSSFSPLSFLGSFFKPGPGPNWHRSRKVHQRKPQPQQQQIIFKPNLLSSQKFASPQAVKKILRFPSRKTKTPLPIQNVIQKTVNEDKSPQQEFIRIISPSNYSLSTTKSTAVTVTTNSSQTPLVTSLAWPKQVTETIKKNSFTTVPSNTDNSDVYSEVTVDESHTTLVPDYLDKLNPLEIEHETVHIIYPTILKENVTREDIKNTEQRAKIVNNQDNVSVNYKEPSPGLYSSLDSTVSGPNPGEDSLGLSNEKTPNYYDQVFQSASLVNNANPYYAPEEFNYNQDPIVLNKSNVKDIELSTKSQEFIIKPRGRTYKDFPQDVTIFPTKATLSETGVKNSSLAPVNATLSSLQEEFVTDVSNGIDELRRKTPKSVDFDKLLIPHRLYDQHLKSHPNEIIKLVNTIEYGAPNYKRTDDSNSKRLIGNINYPPNKSDPTGSLASLVDCGAGREVGFCSITSAYPKERVELLMYGCKEVLQAFKAVISDDLDELGDNSPSVISSEKDLARPWSWKVYAYKKRQVCDSELYFIQPSFARDTKGEWRIILQTESINQRVGIDMCHQPNAPCPGMPDCGKKSRCVQRYNYQLLLSLSLSQSSLKTSQCPSIRAFKFPSGCVCHAETSSDPDLVENKHSHVTF